MPIQKIAIPITIQGLWANKHITNLYVIVNIYIQTKND